MTANRTLACLAALALLACTPIEADPDLDDGTTDKGDGASYSGFYQIADGLGVTRVNRSLTTCADGTRAPSCAIAGIDLDGLGLDPYSQSEVSGALEAGLVLLRGKLETREDGAYLVAREAWRATVETGEGGDFAFVAAEGDGYREHRLNSTRQRVISGVDLAGLALAPLDAALVPELLGSTGVIVRGQAAGDALVASQVYLRYEVRVADGCELYCGGEVCGEPGLGDLHCAGQTSAPVCDQYFSTCARDVDSACGFQATAQTEVCRGVEQ